jgi:hypothetical protein
MKQNENAAFYRLAIAMLLVIVLLLLIKKKDTRNPVRWGVLSDSLIIADVSSPLQLALWMASQRNKIPSII